MILNAFIWKTRVKIVSIIAVPKVIITTRYTKTNVTMTIGKHIISF